MRAAISAFLSTALLLAAPAANAALPGTPHVTVGADIKQLLFDWDDVAGAGYYRLLYKVGSGAYKPLIDNIPASKTQLKLSIAVHLQSWSKIHYAVAACNTSGCTNSADVFPQNLMLDTIGYFKASNTRATDFFGLTVELSDDGRTLAVADVGESSVYVFRRVTSGWRQEAQIQASTQSFGYGSYPSKGLAINANGSLLAVGAPGEDVGWPVTYDIGAVYIYQKSSSGSWSLVTTIHSPSPQQADEFGASVDMSLDGRTLKVTSRGPWNEGVSEARTHIFVRQGDTWQRSVILAPFFAGDTCRTVRLSGDGNTLVSACEINAFVSGCERVGNCATRLETRKRSGNTWIHVADQPLSTLATAIGLVLDFDASTMALQELPNRVVGIYKWTGTQWARERGFPAPFPDLIGADQYGSSLALGRTGNVLAIGDDFIQEAGAGVSPTPMPGNESRGAVYVWRRDDRNPSTWTLRSVVKSPNPGSLDSFGFSVALCGTGHALAVGAYGEDSKATGVDGDRTDNSATDSGAAYLY